MRRIAHRIGALSAGIVMSIACLATTSTAQADTIPIVSNSGESTEGIGSYTGSVSYDSVLGELVVSLTNTSGISGLNITGFVFNIAGDADATGVSGDYPFLLVTNEPAPPFGTYDAGAALNADWSGGGSPVPGIADGETGEFVFTIEGPDAGSLSAADFLSGGFIVRLRGNGSDKVPATVIPLPAPIALGALGLVGVAFGSRRLRKHATL